jgi:hypothetical protein
LVSRLLLTVVWRLTAFPPVETGARQAPERDVFACVRALDDAGARLVWPGFNPSEWPIALFDGQRTILRRHPSSPLEFAPLPGHAGVLVMPGRHPAVVGNSTREIGGVRTATVIATSAPEVDRSAAAALVQRRARDWSSFGARMISPTSRARRPSCGRAAWFPRVRPR